ncbi:MAG: PTS sugar transporter subunit IIA [Eubacteriaceae bacterium]|jgi:PTS system galactitol-specific IIA component
MIWEELNESLIFTGIDTRDFTGIMEKLGGAMIQEGYAKDSYVEALVKREKEFPTGLDINGIGIAIPHTDVSHVNKQGIAIGRLKNPVTFIQMGTEDEVPVRLIFMLSVKDPNAHIDQLQRIVDIIQDQDVLNKLLEVKDASQIIEVIKEKESTL